MRGAENGRSRLDETGGGTTDKGMTEASDADQVILCVELWARPGAEQSLIAYEDEVLNVILPDHGGTVIARARSMELGPGPFEVQLLAFSSERDLESCLADERRVKMTAHRDRVIARTIVFRVELAN